MINYHIKPIAWKTGTQTPGSPNLENGDGVLYFTLLDMLSDLEKQTWLYLGEAYKQYVITYLHQISI